METPESMKAELAAWNGGSGIDLEDWVGCEGRFSLAMGYLAVFWPDLELREGYILHKGVAEDVLRGFEAQDGSTRRSVEATLNHRHLVDIHYRGCPDISADKLLVLGKTLKEIYEAKLQRQFPDRPCAISFFVPENPEAYHEYQVTFWQTAHESTGG